MNLIERFINDEDGAVTVDWVVLTSAIVGLGIAVLLAVGGETTRLADAISAEMSTMSVWTW